MQVILLENIHGLGKMGEEVNVKSGFARNFLIPLNKALYATEEARIEFEAKKAEYEANLAQAKKEADEIAKNFEGISISLTRQASETGQLFGSVKPQNIVDALKEQHNIEIKRQAVQIGEPIKAVGEYDINIVLHSEVKVSLKTEIARQTTISI